MGYSRAGFDVVGVDLVPQPRYPFAFVQGDALEYLTAHGHEYDAIHTSPPCQVHSTMTKGRWPDRWHLDLVAATRSALKTLQHKVPFVIENVPTAPLINPITLCGTMFGLRTSRGNQLRRHRLFEVWPSIVGLAPECQHNGVSAIGVYGGGQHPMRRTRRRALDLTAGGADFGIKERRQAMGIDWMTSAELNQAIPPAYTEFIGLALMAQLNLGAAA